MPSVSVVVPVLNAAATIGDLLAALASQVGAPAECEIIVVDNGSTDGTQDIVRRFAVTLLDEPRRGPAAARNRGLRHARGEIIAHADADTLPTRGWLAAIVAPFAAADVLLVGGRTLAFRPTSGAERFMAQSRVYDTEQQLANQHFPFVPSLNMALRRDAALAIDGWAEELLTAEDVDLCHRLRQRFDQRMVYQPNALLFHRHRATDAQLRRQAFTYGEGAAVMQRRYPEKARWTLYTWAMVGTVLAWHTAQPLLLRGAHRLGWRSAEQLEHAVYQRRWSWSFWRGFFSYRRSGGYRGEVPAP